MGRDFSPTTPDGVSGKAGGIGENVAIAYATVELEPESEPEPEPITTPAPNPILRLTGQDLALRLWEFNQKKGGVTQSTNYKISKMRTQGREVFREWTQRTDEEGIAWTWEGGDDQKRTAYIPWGDRA